MLLNKLELLRTHFPALNYDLGVEPGPGKNYWAPDRVERWQTFSSVDSAHIILDDAGYIPSFNGLEEYFYKIIPGKICNKRGLRSFLDVYVFSCIFNQIFLKDSRDKKFNLEFRSQSDSPQKLSPSFFLFRGGQKSILPVEIHTVGRGFPADTTRHLVDIYNDSKYHGKSRLINAIKRLYTCMGVFGLRFGVLSCYEATWFMEREGKNIRISEAFGRHDFCETLYKFIDFMKSAPEESPVELWNGGSVKINTSRLLGAGAFANVFEADFRRGKYKKKVAAKIAYVDGNAKLKKMMEDEARILKRLAGHRSITPKLYFAGPMSSYFYVLAMEKVDGRKVDFNLMTLNQKNKALEALDGLHKKGVVHNDLQADNMIVAANDKIKIVDFGLASIAKAPFQMIREREQFKNELFTSKPDK